MIDAREIVESLMTTGSDGRPKGASQFDPRREPREADLRLKARELLRFLEECPDDACAMDLREAINDAFPGVLSGGGI